MPTNENENTNEIVPQSPFEQIRHTDEAGDYWLARELMPLLEYRQWHNFEDAIERAIEDCVRSGRPVNAHFRNFTRTGKVSGARGPAQKDYRLTRYACHLVTMASRTEGDVAAQARTYFSDKVEQAEQLDSAEAEQIETSQKSLVEEIEIFSDPKEAFLAWRERAILAFVAEGYSVDWARQRVDDIVSRNTLTHEWSVRGIKPKEYPILTNRLHMGSFGLSIDDHKGFKGFAITYRGKKLVYKGDLPPAMTMTELALNTLANTIARELHVRNDSFGFHEIAGDVDVAGQIVGDTRRQIEAATGRPVVSPRNLLKEPDGRLWAQLPAPDKPLDN